MTDSVPTEVQTLTNLLERVRRIKADTNPTIVCLAAELAQVVPASQVDLADLLFKIISGVEEIIDQNLTTPGGIRTGSRMKSRIRSLISAEQLGKRYDQFQNEQKANVEAILDMLPILDDTKFDNDGLSEEKANIDGELAALLEKISASDEISDSIKFIARGQVSLIRRSLSRFESEGVIPFRDSIYCTVGHLTIVLKTKEGVEADSIRELIDDVVRIKEMAELAGGTLLLTGTVIAGLLPPPG